METSKLRALHIFALQSMGMKHAQICEITAPTPYDSFKNYQDLTSHIKSTLPDIRPSEKDWNFALRQYEINAELRIECIAFNDRRYPRYLKAIDNFPLILFCRGNTAILYELPGVAIVGTRKITPSGIKIAQRVSSYLTNQNWIIVSGLAIGVDSTAHKACVDEGGKTIAVLAHGLEAPQPKVNSRLGYEILEKGGLWVSEHTVNTPIRKEYFVQRNRIQLGLSAGSVIIEAELQSGTMTQANFCKKQGRPLFAVVPDSPENRLGLSCDGTIEMVNKMGAMPLRTKDDYPEMLTRLTDQRALMANI